MRDWRATWKKIRQAPKRDLAFRLAARLRRRLSDTARPPLQAPAYAVELPDLRLNFYDWGLPKEIERGFESLAGASMQGVFDLLGSGPVNAFRGGASPGFDGHRYVDILDAADNDGKFLAAELPPGPLAESQRIWRLIAADYPGIDWGRDLRSGYRWRAGQYHSQIKVMAASSADVKLPLELGRLQHLPWLSLAFVRTSDHRYANALRTHLLDFVAANPPGWGPTWLYAMDAGIRAANIVLAVELLRSAGGEVDHEFEAVIARSLAEHGRFIVENIEWHPDRRTNHYLANLAGLVWIATAIPGCPEAPAWRAFSEWQLNEEILAQFLPDGGNFEASTGYHRLSAEMAIWALARLEACPRGPEPPPGTKLGRFELPSPEHRRISDQAIERLARALRFMKDVTASDGLALQIGDHDSGRFFKLDGEDRIERSLDFSGTIAAGDAYFGQPTTRFAGALMAALVGTNARVQPYFETQRTYHRAGDAHRGDATYTQAIHLGEGVWEGLETIAYSDFGLFLYRSPRALLAIRCGPVGQAGYGGHAHNDALGLELFADGTWLIRDPGSYVYTAVPEERDRYRSVHAHFAPQVEGREPNPLDAGLFRMPERAHAQALQFDREGFVGVHDGYGTRVFRRLEITQAGFDIHDGSDGNRLELIDLSNWTTPPISLGYGHREER